MTRCDSTCSIPYSLFCRRRYLHALPVCLFYDAFISGSENTLLFPSRLSGSPPTLLPCLPFEMQVWSEPPPPTMIRGFSARHLSKNGSDSDSRRDKASAGRADRSRAFRSQRVAPETKLLHIELPDKYVDHAAHVIGGNKIVQNHGKQRPLPATFTLDIGHNNDVLALARTSSHRSLLNIQKVSLVCFARTH
jgi:hypothetical protein